MATDHGNSSLASSFTDLMTSLAVIFILLLVASHNNAQQESIDTRVAIREELKRELGEYAHIEVKDDPNDPLTLLILVFGELLHFEKDKDDVPENGVIFLQKFVPTLARTVCGNRFSKSVHSVVVEGHTDSDGDDEHNLALSQRRSMSVVKVSLTVLREHNPVSQDSLYTPFLNLISASGRGERELIHNIHDGLGMEDMSRSRRVVFKIRIRSLEQRQFINAMEIPLSKPQ